MSRKRSIGADLAARAGAKVNNHPAAARAKAELRRLVLESLGDATPRVFDAFAGDGAMYRAVWHHAAGYVGCDLKWYQDERLAYVADNRRLLRAIDLQPFNIFDLDAYGSPWEQAYIVAMRRRVAPGEPVGLLLTEGSALGVKMGNLPTVMKLLAGVRDVAGASRAQDDLIDRAIAGLCRRMNVVLERRWQAHGKTGAQMRYIGLLLRGKTPQGNRAAEPKPESAD